MIFGKLAAHFPPSAIHWRSQTITGDGTKALALAYLDARDVMDRLDEAVGPANWRDSYEETLKGRLLCTLEIRVDGEWIAKSDGAGNTDVEGEKGAISDALKRAAVKWGIGRYLYDLGNVWAPCESYEANGKKKWRKWAPGADAAFASALARLSNPTPQKVAQDTPDMPDEPWAKIAGLLQATNTDAGALMKHLGITAPNLRKITQADYPKVVDALESKLAKMAKAETNGKAE